MTSVVRAGAEGVTIGSETAGGFRHIDAYNLRVLAPVPNGIVFNSVITRGGWADDIHIHDLQGVRVPVHITLNSIYRIFAFRQERRALSKHRWLDSRPGVRQYCG